MGAETEYLKWKQLMQKYMYFRHAPNSKWGSEKVLRDKNLVDLNKQEKYMLTKGFRFDGNTLITPSGEEHAIT